MTALHLAAQLDARLFRIIIQNQDFKCYHSKSPLQSLIFTSAFIICQTFPDPCFCYTIYTYASKIKLSIDPQLSAVSTIGNIFG